ncbi:MAG: hypothetical protein CM15mP128_2570 [Methanobacteriota archaeon]|nr:MAG: hypothetical protein CM15mP128_2570 [Euryarchaeota archaeon]
MGCSCGPKFAERVMSYALGPLVSVPRGCALSLMFPRPAGWLWNPVPMPASKTIAHGGDGPGHGGGSA